MQKKNGAAETKPFTNFSVFHDNLISRLKQLSQIQLDFDKRAKEAEGRYGDKLTDMRKQLDARWRQLDKFEASLKTLAEAKSLWRKKLSAKEGEVDALKVHKFLSMVSVMPMLTTSRLPTTSSSLSSTAVAKRDQVTRWKFVP